MGCNHYAYNIQNPQLKYISCTYNNSCCLLQPAINSSKLPYKHISSEITGLNYVPSACSDGAIPRFLIQCDTDWVATYKKGSIQYVYDTGIKLTTWLKS